jgi:hypothetical protein
VYMYIHVSSLRWCVHTCTCRYDRAYGCLCVQGWLHLCVHIRAGIIARVCAYTCRHDHTYACIYVQEWLHLCVHTHAGTIARLCAYTCRHDRAYVCIYVRAWSSLCVHIRVGLIVPMRVYMRGQDAHTRMMLCACTCVLQSSVYVTLRQVLRHQVRHKVWVFMATIRQGLETTML